MKFLTFKIAALDGLPERQREEIAHSCLKSPEFKRRARNAFFLSCAGFVLTVALMVILPHLSADVAAALKEHALFFVLAVILPSFPVWFILVPYLLQVRVIQQMARDKVSKIDID